MSDDIFDYFGGNSSRKVEPLDESEMFEDLMPGSEDPDGGIEAAPSDEAADESEIVDAELVEESADVEADDGSVADSPSTKPATEAADDDDPWNDLASSLGLEPAVPGPAKSRTSVVLGEVGLVADLERENTGKTEPQSEPDGPRSSEADSDSVEDDAEEEKSEEVLSEMFVPREDPDAYPPREPVDDLENDPFAAFSGAAGKYG